MERLGVEELNNKKIELMDMDSSVLIVGGTTGTS